MSVLAATVSPDWLALREPADAAARSTALVERLSQHLRATRRMVVHDLGGGSGSMGRWLAPRLAGEQHWVVHDRDVDLLARAAADPPAASADGAPVTVGTRLGDVSRLGRDGLAGADLVVASALLDILTADELDRLAVTCAAARCPVLVTLTVVGRVELDPADPLDELVRSAFDAHQRRAVRGRQPLGPDASDAAVRSFSRLGMAVEVRPSPWRLGADEALLAEEWLAGWVGAAVEQQPALGADAAAYQHDRVEQARAGALSVTVHHLDLLALPR